MKSTLNMVIFLCLLYMSMQAGYQCNVAGCQYCSSPNFCGLCQTNFVLTQNQANGSFYCSQIPCVSNCNYCNISSICTSCSSGFFISSTGSCQQSQTSNSTVPPNCLWGTNSENCTICAYGFTLQAGFCYPTISLTYDDQYCVVKMTSTICQVCQSGFLVSPIGKCIPSSINEQNCNMLNCLYCSNANSTCVLCQNGYQLTSSNTCTQNICNMTGCMSCLGNGQCSLCSPGYMLNPTTKVCSLVGYGCNIMWCQTCSSSQSCGQCQPGFTLVQFPTTSTASVNLCKKLSCPFNVTNCNACQSFYDSVFNYNKVLCAPGSCLNGYINVNGYCVANITSAAIPCSQMNCVTCSYNNFCSACDQGYSLTKYGTCQVTVCAIPNCASCSLNNICQKCASGFSLSIGAIYMMQNNLYMSPSNYANFLYYQQCIPSSISCNVTYCAYCSTTNQCQACATGYDFSESNSNTCSPTCTVQNCYQCSQSNQGTCQICESGYTLAGNGSQCTAISFTCGSGCSNSTSSSTCAYNLNTNSGECFTCQSGMTLQGGQCYSATCNLFGCSLCASWATPVVCMRCNQGLILINGYCIQHNCQNGVANCIGCIQGGKCFACSQGFYLNNSTGTAVCVAANSITNCMATNCLACVSGSSSQCQTCASPYKLWMGICVCGFQNCLDCVTSALACDSCPSPLFATLSYPGCTPEPSLKHTCSLQNCEMCLSSTQCAICAVGYSLNPDTMACVLNNCATLGLANCQLCDQFGYQCQLCNTGYMINNFLQGGSCFVVSNPYSCNITGCAVCSSTNNSQCASCLPTYTASGVTLCIPNVCNISNCYLCLQNNFCTFCDSGYFLTTSLTCQPIYSNLTNCQNQIQYCDICVINLVNTNGLKYCIKCQDGFQFDSTNQVCIPQSNTIPNCAIQQAHGFALQPYCVTCIQGYFTNSWGLCTAYNPATQNAGCSVYNCLYCAMNNTSCSFCLAPWGISSTGICQATIFCPSNCQFCTNPSTCLTCVATFTLNTTGTCILCNITGCSTCQVANFCNNCQHNFTGAKGICLACPILNCLGCSSNNVCQTCANGTTLSSTRGSCVACSGLTNCVSCTSTNSCGICQAGYQLFSSTGQTTDQVCILCNKPNCLSCNTNGCALCASNYNSDGNGNCVQCLFPCVTCNPNSSCLTCSTPFYFLTALSAGTCVVNSIPNCISYSAINTSQCTGCNTTMIPYSLSSSNTCVLNCPQNCGVCVNNLCTTCLAGFLLSSGACSACQVAGCADCSSNIALCNTCQPGFYPMNQQCKICPSLCSTCSSTGTCTALINNNQQVLVTINGQTSIAICQQNCVTCSNVNPQICLQCASGFYLNTVTGNCQLCSASCQTCSSTSPTQCLSCYTSAFLTNGTCAVCSSNCMTCSGANDQSSCMSCYEGFFLSGTTCIAGCPQNCLMCSSLTVCTQCSNGYTLFLQGTGTICAPCISTCRTCAKGQPATCLSCGPGFYISAGNCIACTVNCNNCNSAGCMSCISGFFLTSALTCSLNCAVPCSSCLTGNPTKCTNCVAGYTPNSLIYSCTPVISCNGTCSVCPLGYTLNLVICIACTGSQCQSCLSSALSQCTSCVPGYYLNTNSQCQACLSQCATCLTGSGCLTCSLGYTQIQNVPANQNGYQCVICQSPCATCTNRPDYCTSCVSGFQFQGWKCSQSFYFGFTLTLLTTLSTFNKNYFSFILALTSSIGRSNPNSITILGITSGSVLVQGGAGPSGTSGSKQSNQQFSSLTASLSTNSQIAGMSVGSSSVTVVGGSIDYNSTNLALILGICIPVGVLLITGIVLYIYCKKKRSSDMIQQRIKEDSGFTVRESFQLSTNYKDQNTNKPFEQNTAIN